MIEHLPEQVAQPYGIIYLATNTANGKEYVGQTVQSLKTRIAAHQQNAHMRRGKSYFHSALRKYGFESFTWQTLVACDNRNDLNATEQAYVTTMKTKVPNGYNLTDGGGGTSGLSPSAESTQKMSEAHKGKVVSAETRQKIREARMGKAHSVESRQKMSESRKGSTAWNKGMAPSAETRQKLREANIGKVVSVETRLKISESMKRYRKSIR